MNRFVAQAHEHQWPSEEYWAELDRWLAAREEHSKQWETPEGISTAQWKTVQLIFVVIQGFFDDSLGGAPGSPPQRDGDIGTCVGIFPLLVNAVVSFAKDHGKVGATIVIRQPTSHTARLAKPYRRETKDNTNEYRAPHV
eukprot:COSAG01_NODE_346_length_18524_cov_35.929661_7_plen_140_part_00